MEENFPNIPEIILEVLKEKSKRFSHFIAIILWLNN
jgi:hypothetical protein